MVTAQVSLGRAPAYRRPGTSTLPPLRVPRERYRVDRLRIRPGLDIPLDEIELVASRSSGPGGQHVNKVDTRVEARFDVASSPSLPDDVRARLLERLGGRLTREGVLRVTAQKHRSQWRNRQEALARLAVLLARALTERKPRRPTRPSKAAESRRLEGKRRRGMVKQQRSRPDHED